MELKQVNGSNESRSCGELIVPILELKLHTQFVYGLITIGINRTHFGIETLENVGGAYALVRINRTHFGIETMFQQTITIQILSQLIVPILELKR